MRLGITHALALAALVTVACGGDPASPPVDETTALDRAVAAQAEQVRAAARAYRDEYGAWPDYPCDDLIALLPGGERLAHPVNGNPTEPCAYEPASVGATSYRVLADTDAGGNRRVLGYYILGRGETRDVVLTNLNDAQKHLDREAIVQANCYYLLVAGLAYGDDNNGVCAPNGDMVNAAGKTLMDYLPNGTKLLNPYTGLKSEPSMWEQDATGMGQLSYTALDLEDDDVMEGFEIQAAGGYAPTPIFRYRYLAGDTWQRTGADFFTSDRPCVAP